MTRDRHADRLADLEQEAVRLRGELQRSAQRQARRASPPAIRWARTVAVEEAYPSADTNPNTYPIVLVDFEADSAAGQQAVTPTERQTTALDTVTNLADGRTTLGIYHYIPQGTYLPVWRVGTRWWTCWQSQQVFPVVITSSPVASGGSTTVTLPDGREVSATNQTSVTLATGRATVYQSTSSKLWYLTGGGGEGGDGGGSVWRSLAYENISAGDSGEVILSDPGIGTAGHVIAVNWSLDVEIETSDKIHVYRDPYTELYYAIKSGGGGVINAVTSAEQPPCQPGEAVLVTYLNGDTPVEITALNWSDDVTLYAAQRVLLFRRAGGWYVIKSGSFPRWYIASTGSPILPTDGTPTVEITLAFDEEPLPETTSVAAMNTFRLAAEPDDLLLLVEVQDNDINQYMIVNVQHHTIEVVVDVRYDAESHKWQKKTRQIAAVPLGDESDWTDVLTLTEIDQVINVDVSGGNLRQTKQKIYVAEAAAPGSPATIVALPSGEWVTQVYIEGNVVKYDTNESVGTEVFTFTQIDVVSNVFMSGLDEKQTKRTALVYSPGTTGDSTVVAGTACDEEE